MKLFIAVLLLFVSNIVTAEIVSSEIVSNRSFGPPGLGARRIREKHEDHLGNIYYKSYIRDVDFADIAEQEAILAISADAINTQLIEQEISNAIAVYENGGDPLHTEVSANNWQPITPNYQTWEQLAKPVTISFLERDSKLELDHIYSVIVRMSGQTKATLWEMTIPEVNAVNADIQEAHDLKIQLDAYSPYFIDGVKQ